MKLDNVRARRQERATEAEVSELLGTLPYKVKLDGEILTAEVVKDYFKNILRVRYYTEDCILAVNLGSKRYFEEDHKSPLEQRKDILKFLKSCTVIEQKKKFLGIF